ncbi:MAG: hypothetical protein ABUS79_31755, partial [Pseudomonadota bacterium]
MLGPLAGVRFIHSAILREATAIELQAAELTAAPAAESLARRVTFFERINLFHTQGEEKAIFPRLESKVKHQSAPYLMDHED